MRFVFTICSVLIAGSLLGHPMDSLRSEQREEGLFVIHQVDDQETLYSIARRCGGEVQLIIKHNDIVDNRIEIGQIIEVLVVKNKNTSMPSSQEIIIPKAGYHMVKPGETLYSISRQYDVKLKDLRKWNNLEGNAISPGMNLLLSEDTMQDVPDTTSLSVKKEVVEVEPEDTTLVDPYLDFEKYFVQTGETLYTIASKIAVSMDSLRYWNKLSSDFLKIGQPLYYKGGAADSVAVLGRTKDNRRTRIDENGFEKIYEEGVASVIASMNTTKYLALHRTLPIGTNLEVRNLMNNQVVHVKVIGRLPNTGINKNILLRLSAPAYEQLGILDVKSRVEVSYFKK